jgi:methionyl-tRNA synthetase
MSERQILVTAALPYANGHIHVGHLVEYIQTDVWVRFQKLRGNRCIYICADDTHGTAIMIRARTEGRTEEEVIADMKEAHVKDFRGFNIEFDNFGSTNSDENRELCAEFWQSIRDAGLVKEKSVEQLFDPEAGTFLADRFVRGTCPKCAAENQPGDNCSKCGSTYSPVELVNPQSTLSDATPELRSALHLFIELEQLHGFLDEWTQSGTLQPEIANYLKGHFLGEPADTERDPLRDWDISRPAPYFGFEIPDSPGNFWYVWFDAPIGYMASTKQWCNANDEEFDSWWRNSNCEIHHFIGKDITYFHTLFWPGMLKSANFNLPTKVHIHGFLTVDGKKMAKSDGTFILASTYRKHLNPEWFRYYITSKLSSKVDDIDLNLEEFIAKVNSDLVGKVVNIASRSAKFISGSNLAKTYPDDGGLFANAASKADEIADLYERCEYSAAMREIMALADAANRYVEEKQPWTLRKDPTKANEVRDICSVALNLFRQLVIYLSPVLPEIAERTVKLLNSPINHWDDVLTPLAETPVRKFKHMMQRVTEEQVKAMTEESSPETSSETPDSNAPANAEASESSDAPESGGSETLAAEPLAEECTIDDFTKVDLRVALVVKAEDVPEADKLLKLTLSLGGDVERTVFAGMKAAYKPEEMEGRLVILCANLKPRKMRFGKSEGMVLASGSGGADVFLLSPDSGAVPGQRVH